MYPTFSFIAKMGNARSASYSYQDLTSFSNESCSVNTYTLTEESYHSAYRPPCGSSSCVSAPGPAVGEGPVNYPMQQIMEAKIKLQHRAASCASLIRSTQDLSAIDTSIVSSPFRRHAPQFLSLRSYSQSRRRPLDHRLIYGTVRSTTSSPSLSVRNELAMKTRAYVSDARRRRQTVEQTLWAAEKNPRVSLGSEPLSDLSFTETANQGPWNTSEDEANDTNQRDAYSIHSQSDASFVTMATTMTSLPPSSTNYNTSATMMLPLMNYSMRSDQGYGSTSGIFYLDCLKQLLGKIPSYVHLQQGRLHLKLRRDDVMEDCEGAVRIGEIADLLKASFAIVTGGRSRDGCPILTFPDRGNFSSLTAEDYRKLVIYLTAVPPLQDADLGFVVIIDRRTDRWSSVKTALLRINSFFPGLITVAYVLRPSGLLQKAISEVSNKFFREEFHFKVVVLSCLEELHHKIDASQLVPELGGYLSYDHKAWIETRVAVETFSANTCDISAGLRKFSRRLQDCEVPNDVPTIESLLTKQNQDYSSLKEELAKACRQGETLLQLIKDPGNAETLPRQPDPAQIVNITAIQRLLIQMEETEKTLEDFWSRHEAHLNLCLQLRRFELEFRELQGIFESNMKELSLLEQDGDTVATIDSILEETLHFKNNCQVDLDRAAGLEDQAARLMANYGHNSALLDSVRPKSVEIQRMGHNLREMLTRRLENLHKSRDLYYRIEKVNMWCSQGIELLASQQLEKFASRDFAEQSLAEIESFLQSANELVQTDSKDFRAIFQDLVTPETKALIHQVLQRLEDVHIMCEKRATGLRRIALRLRVVRPIQPVPPEPVPPVPAQVRKVSTPEAETGRVAGEGSANAKLGHVLAELLDTERTYVSEIAIILKGYRDELLEDSRHVAPSLLVEKCDLLFGNLPEIGDFHGRVFLPDLERCAPSTQLVARCFLQHSDILHELYSFYCQNIPQSEELRRQVGEQHPFFRECQQQLGHKLPLSAYLLKPVQRITKYQLLIRDLIKYSAGGDQSENSDLQAALDVMLAVLRCVNDSMHQVAISGYHGSLAELGRLLLQGGFSVWAEGKRDRLRELRLKPMQRHVFLYERGVVFCKRVGKDPDKATYQFKHVLKMSEVGLTETVHNGRGSDARKFELWLQGRQEVWVLQAPSRDVKETWTTEVKRVLLNQFHQLKGQTQQTTARMGPHNYNPAYGPKLGPSSAALPHKPLRQTTSWEYSPSTGSSSSGSDRNSVADSAIGSSSNSTTSCASKFVRSSTADEDDGWSTDFSLSDDEPGESYLDRLESLRRRYIVLADYAPLGPTEAFLKEGDVVDLVRIGCAGWWYVRPIGGSGSSSQEGWAPSAYLEPCPSNVKSPCSSGTPSLSSHDSEHEPCAH